MGYTVTAFETTPNPNAVKCLLDRAVCDAPRSFRTKESAAGDAIASALFAIPGVTNVLMNADWITVNKSPEAEWKGIKAGVKRVLEAVIP